LHLIDQLNKENHMKARSLILLIVLALIVLFALLNWGVFMAPTTLSLGITEVQAPFGLVMLGLMAFLTMLFLVFVVYLQSGVLLEARRNARELQANRELADKAEASRFTDLREFLAAELQIIGQQNAELKTALLARLEQSERELQTSIEQSGNTLAAYVGELGDRLNHGPHNGNL
jgi:uncharacterized integral membrane protein